MTHVPAHGKALQDKLDTKTKLYHALREEWKGLHGQAREDKAKEISYIQQQMYGLSDQITLLNLSGGSND